MDHTADTRGAPTAPATKGHVIHWAGAYDLLAWAFLRGRERAFRERVLDLARVAPGETVLDIGCGTGTLALIADERVGASGAVHGIDPSPEMIARASTKARRSGKPVAFRTGAAEALPYADASFDVVLSTLMMHHLPRAVRRQCIADVARVVVPGGRLLIVDFGRSSSRSHGIIEHLHRHGPLDLVELQTMLTDAGLRVSASGAVGVRSLDYILAERAP